MKKLIILCVLYISTLSITAQSQDTPLSITVNDISGRWTEVKENKESTDSDTTGSFTYIFRDNMVFHCGEAFEGVILFNVAGKYSIEKDLIKVVYFDFSQSNTESSKKTKLITFKILALKDNQMTALVKDYGYEYKIILKRENS